jgi:hypothetical protein
MYLLINMYVYIYIYIHAHTNVSQARLSGTYTGICLRDKYEANTDSDSGRDCLSTRLCIRNQMYIHILVCMHMHVKSI